MPEERRSVVASADLRYAGQHHEVSISFPPGDLDHLERIEQAFHRRHEELYGFSSPGKQMEIVNLHATVLGRRQPFALEPPGGDGTEAAPRRGRRRIVSALDALARRGRGARRRPDGARPGRVRPGRGRHAHDHHRRPESFDVAFDASGSFVLTRR